MSECISKHGEFSSHEFEAGKCTDCGIEDGRLVVFYGPRRSADYWARAQQIDPRAVVLATNPEALRGRSGGVRKVHESGWLPRGGNAVKADLTDEYIGIMELTGRGKSTDEWA